jgi:molecular chaperone GrpE
MAEDKIQEPAQSSAALPPELAALTAEEWADRYARLLAEFDNYRKRTRAEMERQAEARKTRFVADLLEVVDNFERALAAANDSDATLAQGMQAIDRQLRDLLAANAITPFEALGKPFDPHCHEALGVMDAPSFPPDTVCAVIRNGWMQGDQVLRPACVMVSREPDVSQ